MEVRAWAGGPGRTSLLQTKGYTDGARQRTGDKPKSFSQSLVSDSSKTIGVFQYVHVLLL